MSTTPSQLLQTAAWFLVVVEFILMLYALLLNPRHIANRAVAALLGVITLNTLGIGLVLDQTSVYLLGLPLYAATTTAVVAALLSVTVVLIKPEWLPGGQRSIPRARPERGLRLGRWRSTLLRFWNWSDGLRRAWWLVYGLDLMPIVLTLIDGVFGTRLWYTPPAGYVGGFVPIGESASGAISGFLRAPMTYVLGSLPILMLIYVLARDQKASAVTRRLAWLLLIIQTVALVLMSTQRGPVITPSVALVVSVLYTGAFAYAAFQQMISERRAQAGRVQTRLTILLVVAALPLFVGLIGVVL